MFGQIIDLLVKQDDERRKILFLVLKVIFSATLATKIYSLLVGPFSIISITDFEGVVKFFLNGRAVVSIAIFIFVWTSFYGLISALFSLPTIWLTSKLYFLVSQLLKITRDEFNSEYQRSKWFRRYVKVMTALLNSTDIIEYEDNVIRPGRSYYKFYDYLVDLKAGKKNIDVDQFLGVIALVIQFIVIYNWLDLKFLSYSNWFFYSSIILMTFLILFSFFAYVIATLVDIKHSRILNFLEQITPQNEKTNE